eukprot:2665168-Amphidinium_carterae.1
MHFGVLEILKAIQETRNFKFRVILRLPRDLDEDQSILHLAHSNVSTNSNIASRRRHNGRKIFSWDFNSFEEREVVPNVLETTNCSTSTTPKVPQNKKIKRRQNHQKHP